MDGVRHRGPGTGDHGIAHGPLFVEHARNGAGQPNAGRQLRGAVVFEELSAEMFNLRPQGDQGVAIAVEFALASTPKGTAADVNLREGFGELLGE